MKKKDKLFQGREVYAQLLQPDGGMSFRKQGLLISDAFLVSNLVEVLTRVSSGSVNLTELERDKLAAAQELFDRLMRAERYVNQERTNLMPQPEGVGVITSIMDEGWIRLDERIAGVANLIQQVRKTEILLTLPLTDEIYASSIQFLRSIHRGIMDQLTEYPGEPTTYLF